MARIAIFAAPLFEDLELHYPRLRLLEAGHEVVLLGIESGTVQGKRGLSAEPDTVVSEVESSRDFDAVVVPGGWSPDYLRRSRQAIQFLREFQDGQRPVAAICHGPWALISADLLTGKTVTSFPSLRDDVENAGAEWVDREVMVDDFIITSRKPDDLPAFMRELLKKLPG